MFQKFAGSKKIMKSNSKQISRSAVPLATSFGKTHFTLSMGKGPAK